MIREFKFGEDCRSKLLRGVEIMNAAASPTLGPRGKLVSLDRGGSSHLTKDGVTVARSIELEDRFENMGVQLAREASMKSGDVGDGTTTTIVLTYALAKEGIKAETAGYSATDIKVGMKKAVDEVVDYLKNNSIKINIEDTKKIAMISSNGDEKISNLVSEAFSKLGKDAVITIEEANIGETSLEVKEGLTVSSGYISSYLANNDKGQSELKDCFVLVTDFEISNPNQLMPLFNQVAKAGKPLVIFAEDITGDMLPFMAVNNQNGSLRVNAIKVPRFGQAKKDLYNDIATYTGACLISEDFGSNLSVASIEMLGKATKVVSDEESTAIIGGGGNSAEIAKRVAEIKTLIADEKDPNAVKVLRERLSKLTAGVAVINVAAPTSAEVKEVKDRVDDTICAVRASLKEGVSIGGGISLLLAAKELTPKDLTEEQSKGYNIVKKALEYPLRTLANNADMSPDVVINKTLTDTDGKSGFNMLTREWEDNLIEKVIDPTLVEIEAVKNSYSAASLILNTEVAVAEKKEKE